MTIDTSPSFLDFVKSFEDTVNQKRFEDLERTLRAYTKVIKMYQEITDLMRRYMRTVQLTTQTQRMMAMINEAENGLLFITSHTYK